MTALQSQVKSVDLVSSDWMFRRSLGHGLPADSHVRQIQQGKAQTLVLSDYYLLKPQFNNSMSFS